MHHFTIHVTSQHLDRDVSLRDSPQEALVLRFAMFDVETGPRRLGASLLGP